MDPLDLAPIDGDVVDNDDVDVDDDNDNDYNLKRHRLEVLDYVDGLDDDIRNEGGNSKEEEKQDEASHQEKEEYSGIGTTEMKKEKGVVIIRPSQPNQTSVVVPHLLHCESRTALYSSQPGAYAVIPNYTGSRESTASIPELMDDNDMEEDDGDGDVEEAALPMQFHAEVVKDRDLEEEVQIKLRERTVTASSVVLSKKDGNKKEAMPPRKSFFKKAVIVFVVGVIFLGGTIMGVLLAGSKHKTNHTASKDDSSSSTTTNSSSPLELARNLLTSISGIEALTDESSFQYQALEWLVNKDPARLVSELNDVHDPDQTSLLVTIVERYVTALLYFATSGPHQWRLSLEFLTASSVCQWPAIRPGEDDDLQLGVRCNDNGEVKYIRLGE
jgi:hypothetical protein